MAERDCSELSSLPDSHLARYVAYLDSILPDMARAHRRARIQAVILKATIENALEGPDRDADVDEIVDLYLGSGVIIFALRDAVDTERLLRARITLHVRSRQNILACLQQRQQERVDGDPRGEEDVRHGEEIDEQYCFWNPWDCSSPGSAGPVQGPGSSSSDPIPEGEVTVEESQCQGPAEQCVPGYGDDDGDDGAGDGTGGGG